MCVCIFAFWQEIHCLAQRLTSLDIPSHRKREEMRRLVARMPGWPSEWMCAKTCLRKERGTRGLKVDVETSPKREIFSERGTEVMERDGNC